MIPSTAIVAWTASSSARSRLARLQPQQAWDAVRNGAILVDIRPEFQRRADGEIPGAIVVERNHLEWRLHPASADRIPEAADVDVKVEEKDIRVDVYRSSGPGGQGVNTTDSAVRITHIPTGLVVTCQDERSQLKNRAKALRVLKARLLERAQEEQQAAIAADRRSQVGTGERSERIRTYNFAQNRVTDHRVGVTLHRLPEVLEGDIDEVIEALAAAEQAERLERVAQ